MSSDDRLVELVIDGDDTAFELLYARHVAEALAFADGLLGSREEAEEAVRHSFAAAHAYLAGGGRRTAFEPWLYTILDNHCLSVLQRRAGGAEVYGEAATPYPAAGEESATVVDLDEWRRKRKLIGAGLPIAPSAGFHDSVMTACGIGTGTAAAAAPLLGGTLAKVAVVALLAGGAGVAGDVASDNGGSVEAGVGAAPAPPAVESSAFAPVGGLAPRSPTPDRSVWIEALATPAGPAAEKIPGMPSGRADVVSPLAAATIPPRPSQEHGAPPRGDGSRAPTPVRLTSPVDAPALGAPDRAVTRRLGDRVEERLQSVGRRVKARLPSLDESPRARLPTAVKPPEIDLPGVVEPPPLDLPSTVKPPKAGDDEGMIPVKPPLDVGRLLPLGVGSSPT